jgi:hypothetical protein
VEFVTAIERLLATAALASVATCLLVRSFRAMGLRMTKRLVSSIDAQKR